MSQATDTAQDTPPAHHRQDEGGRRKRAPLSEGAKAERKLGWLLCAPSVIVMVAVTAYPIVYAIYLSLKRYDLRFPQASKFIGFANYATVLGSSQWWRWIATTLVILIISVAIEFVLGMLIALLMHRTIYTRGAVRTAVLIPYGIVTVVAAYSWQYAWTPGTGYFASILPGGSAPLTHTYESVAIIILSEIWKATPFMALLLLAGLSLVPDDLLNAARVDGATAWQRFTKVTLPLMKPAILVAVLFRSLDAFRIFDNIYILTGGTNNTASVSIGAYDNLFTALNLGVGSALSVLIFIATAIIAFLFIKGFGAAAPGSDLD
ncbi:carbohydrate ABC transporter permease [uncultured Jatrophihabitans sp.]|uniref:carbohydrate ABC transporter permease n=1 Tax=uncultured Jatrophihabitans sp. TaxID=1610747 RepID=UPI0035C9BDB1